MRRLVDQVAAQQAVAPWPRSPDRTTPEFEAWSTLAARVGARQIPLLLRHESPALRVYAARHLLRSEPARAKSIAPLFFDQAPVRLRMGRGRVREVQRDVGSTVLEIACAQSAQPPIRELLAEAVRNQGLGSFRTDALACISRVEMDRPLVRTLALELLSENHDAYLPASLRALSLAKDKDSLPRIEPYASHRDPLVRQAAADAISALGGSQRILRGLLRDRDPRVRAAALAGYRPYPGAGSNDVKLLSSLLKDDDMRVRAEAAAALVRIEEPSAYARIEAYLAQDPNAVEALEPLGRVQNEVSLRLLRKMAADSPEMSVRMHAMRQLIRARDTQSAAIFEEALRSAILTERVLGAEGIAGLGEKSAVPRLITMMQKDPQPSGQLAAVRALGHLATKESLEALSAFVAAGAAREAIVREAAAILDRQKERPAK